MRTITLEQTCPACPEQYWAHSGTETIGYIRLRWGHLTCDYLQDGCPRLSDNDIRVVDYYFNEHKFKGSFDTDEERKEWLDKCKDALMREYQKHKSKKS